jgi:hypothetical protein
LHGAKLVISVLCVSVCFIVEKQFGDRGAIAFGGDMERAEALHIRQMNTSVLGLGLRYIRENVGKFSHDLCSVNLRSVMQHRFLKVVFRRRHCVVIEQKADDP